MRPDYSPLFLGVGVGGSTTVPFQRWGEIPNASYSPKQGRPGQSPFLLHSLTFSRLRPAGLTHPSLGGNASSTKTATLLEFGHGKLDSSTNLQRWRTASL